MVLILCSTAMMVVTIRYLLISLSMIVIYLLSSGYDALLVVISVSSAVDSC